MKLQNKRSIKKSIKGVTRKKEKLKKNYTSEEINYAFKEGWEEGSVRGLERAVQEQEKSQQE